MKLPYIKEIFDPIHGFIKLTQEEVNIIDKLIFQRLHNINQLGTLRFRSIYSLLCCIVI